MEVSAGLEALQHEVQAEIRNAGVRVTNPVR
jgi:hypothetical protein